MSMTEISGIIAVSIMFGPAKKVVQDHYPLRECSFISYREGEVKNADPSRGGGA